MTARRKTDFRFIEKTWFSLFWRHNETGMTFGVCWKGRDIHLTIFQVDNVINAHIKDDGKMVWTESMTIDEMANLSKIMEERCLRTWGKREKMIPILKDDIESLEYLFRDGTFERTYDFSRLIKEFAPVLARILQRPRIRVSSLVQGSVALGLQKRISGWYWVVVEPNGEMLRLPVDISRTPMGKTPIDRGFRKYMKYLKKAGFFDAIDIDIEPKKVEAFVSELKLAILEGMNNDRTEPNHET